MSERYTIEQHEAHVRANQEREAEEEQARRDKTEKANARRGWIADGGRVADFEAAWPRLRDDARLRRIQEKDNAAREEHSRSGMSRI